MNLIDYIMVHFYTLGCVVTDQNGKSHHIKEWRVKYVEADGVIYYCNEQKHKAYGLASMAFYYVDFQKLEVRANISFK